MVSGGSGWNVLVCVCVSQQLSYPPACVSIARCSSRRTGGTLISIKSERLLGKISQREDTHTPLSLHRAALRGFVVCRQPTCLINEEDILLISRSA